MTAQLDLARAAGLLAADDKSSDDSSDEYGSDDDLDDSAETQATKMHAALLKRLADTDKRMLDKWLADDEQDYQANCAVLDQSTVTRRLETLNLFARHLQKVCKNRSSLLTRLAEPLAEEHWLLDPNYHQQLVNAFAAMNEMISQLPSIATAARHCLSPKLALKQQSSEEGHTAAEMPATTDNARQIAQMEKLIHEVEQADEWLQSSSMGSMPLPTVALSSNSGCVDRL
ncbi:hypothetical protein GQ54DRAFT_302572 [Martensiomyces pterosporus]|nr:hypothetical protein GQ54DRAFT_302572 [Martensiomyces pterosporus]